MAELKRRDGTVIASDEKFSLCALLTAHRANISQANLAGENLSRANLSGANLAKANLCGANLAGADLHRANLYKANLAGAKISWTSHSLLFELLAQHAETLEQKQWAALVIAGERFGWCWNDMRTMPGREWRLSVYAQYVRAADDILPKPLVVYMVEHGIAP